MGGNLSARAASETLGVKAPLKRDICRNREGFGPAYRGWNTDYYNFDPIVTNLKAHKGDPSKGRERKTSS
jgi:hypothetical protein